MGSGSGSGPFRPPSGAGFSSFGAPNQQFQAQPSPQQQQQENAPPAFGNRPRPVPITPFGSSSSRGGALPIRGRGGGGVRPSSSFTPRPPSSSSSQTDPSLPSSAAAVPRIRPFANRSAVFNKPDASSSASAPSANTIPAPTQSAPFASSQTTSSAFGSSAFGSQPTSSFAFGSSSSTFGSALPSGSAAPPGEMQAPSAQASSQSPAFGSFATTTTTQTSTAPSGVPPSSFSNFLRKDRASAPPSGASSPLNGASTPTSNEPGADKLDEDEQRKKRFEDAPKVGNRWLEMKGGREALRTSYIKSGILPDPDKPTDLALAVKLKGTCLDMCPEYEREEREFQKELDPLEMRPGTDRVDARYAVKIYRRPAAGRELPLPDDVRPPPVLKQTLDYLFHELLPPSPEDPRFTAVQGFIWNRTRAVRQDFIVQSEGGAIAIECHERIARYHILCLHWRGGPGSEGWSEQQELEQLRKTMRSLIEFYDDRRRSGHSSPNEAEFRSYNLLLHLRDPETLREAELLPGPIFRAQAVQSALNLRQLAQRSNNLEKRGQPRNTEATLNFFSKFFAELSKPNVNYLMACLAENSFSSIRIGALKAMSKAYMSQHRALPIETVQKTLGLDDAQQVMDMAQHLGIELEWEEQNGQQRAVAVKIDRSTVLDEAKPLSVPFSSTIVEAKRGRYTSAQVVDGQASGAVAPLPGAAPLPSPRHAQPPSFFASATRPTPSSQPLQQAVSQPGARLSGLSAAAPSFTPSNVFSGAQPSSAPSPSPSFSFAAPPNKVPSSSSMAFGAAMPSAATSASTGSPFPSAFDASAKTKPASSIPSFFSSPQPHVKAEPAKRSVETSKSEANQATAAPLRAEPKPVEQKPSAAELAQQAEKQRRAQKQKEAARKYAAQKASNVLVNDFCLSASKRAASAAMEREVVRRRNVSRQQVLAKLASKLLATLVDEQSSASAEIVARSTIADTFSCRRLTSVALDKWKAAMAVRRDYEAQKQRLEEIRQQLRRRNVLTPMLATNGGASIRHSLLTGERSPKSKTKRKFDETGVLCSDEEMRTRFVRTQQKRAELWEEGSMLSRLADHIDELFLHFKPADLDQFTAVYSGAGNHVASRWLRIKFGLDDDQEKTVYGDETVEIDLADGSRFQLVDAVPQTLDLARTGEEVGMLIFELNPAIAQTSTDDQRNKLLQDDRARLHKLAQSVSVTRSLLSCRILLVSWGKSTNLLSQLGAADKSGWAQAFDKVGVLELSDASASPEIALSAVLEDVMPDMQPNPRRQRYWSLQDLTEGLYEQWMQFATVASGLCADLPSSEAETFACKTVQILTALANHLLQTVISLSDTILEDDEEANVLVPVPSSDPGKGVIAMALGQINTLPEEQAFLARSKLVAHNHPSDGTVRLAVDQHVGALLMLSLEKLASVWIQVHDEAQAAPALAAERETFDRLCRAAMDELSATSRSIWTRHREIHPTPASPVAPSHTGLDIEMEPIELREGLASPHLKTTATASLKTASSVANLRALVARTNAFLDT